MRIILSRKGFDTTYGGVPSPIIDGIPTSLPIPTSERSVVRFCDVDSEACRLVADLTAGRYSLTHYCHLDPDLVAGHLPRAPGWRGALGQCGAASRHLMNRGVQKGDVFLFFGLFRPLRTSPRLEFVGRSHHRIFGWLQIDEIIPVGADGTWVLTRHPWLSYHPHARTGWHNVTNNALYLATERLHIDGAPTDLPGWGSLRSGLTLTAEGERASIWQVPAWLHPHAGGVGMTYHPAGRWMPGQRVQSAYPGQEFVADIGRRSDARDWLLTTLEEMAYA